MNVSQLREKTCGPDLRRLKGMTPGDSEAGTVSVSVTGVVAVVVSSSDELMKEVVLEAEGLVVTGVCASCSPSGPSPSPSGSLRTPERDGGTNFRTSSEK